MTMTKNKKKLRRLERRTGISRAAQTLVLTGALLVGSVTGAGAATYDLNDIPTATAGHGSGDLVSATVTGAITWDPATSKFIIHANDVASVTASNVITNGNLDIGDGIAPAKLTFGITGEARTFTVGATAVANSAGSNGILSIKSGAVLIVGVTTSTSAAFQVGSNANTYGLINNVGMAGGSGTLDQAGTLTLHSVGVPSFTLGGTGGTGNVGTGANTGGVGGAGNLNFTAGIITAASGSALKIGGAGGVGGAGAASGSTGSAGGTGGIGTLTASGATALGVNNTTVLIGGAGGAGGNDNDSTAAGGAGGTGGAGSLVVDNGGALTITSSNNGATIQVGGQGGNGGTGSTAGTKGNGGAGLLNVVSGGTLNLDAGTNTVGITLGGVVGSAGNAAGTVGTGTVTIAGTMNVYGGNLTTLTVNNVTATNGTTVTGTLNVGNATTQGALTLADGGAGNGDLMLVDTGGVVNVTSIAGNASTLTSTTTVNTGGILNLTGSTAKGSVHTGAVTLNGVTATLNATDGVTLSRNSLSNALTFDVGGGIVNVGTASAAGFLTITNAFTIANGGEVNLLSGSGLTSTANTTMTKGILALSGGSTHTGNVTLNGGVAGGVKLTVSGGTAAAPNAIAGTLGVTSNASLGTVTVGSTGNAAALSVSTASTLGAAGGAAGRATMTIADGSSALFAGAGNALIIDNSASVTADNYHNLAVFGGSTGLFVANTGVKIDNGGMLNILGNHVFNNGAANTGMTFTNGTLRVGGELTSGLAFTANQGFVAKTYKSTNTANSDGMTTGTLTLLGTGNTGATVMTLNTAAGPFAVSGGTLDLGGKAADLTALGLAANYAKGGHINNAVTLSGTGQMHVNGGVWTIANAGNGTLTVGATVTAINQGLFMDQGSLTVDKLVLTASGQATVGSGTQLATLTVTGTSLGSLATVAQAANVGLTVKNLGALHVQQAAVFNGGATVVAGVNTMQIDTGGILYLDGIGLSLTKAQMTAAHTALATGAGLVNFGKAVISDLGAGPVTYASVAGLASDQLLGTTVTAVAINAAGLVGGFKNIEMVATGNTTLSTGGTFELAGGTVGTQLVSGLGAGNAAAVTVTAGDALTLGNVTPTVAGAKTNGILTGAVALATGASVLNAVNGTFSMTGNLTQTAGVGAVNVSNAALTVGGAIGAVGNASNVDINSGGSLTGTDAVVVNNATLNGGSLVSSADTKVAANGNLTVGGLLTVNATGGIVGAGNDLALNGGASAITGNTVLTAGRDLTAANTVAAGGTAALAVQAARDINVGGANDITTAGGALIVQAGTTATSNILARNITAGGGKALTVSAGNNVTANNIATTGKLAMAAGGTVTTAGSIAGGVGSAVSAGTLTAAGNVVLDGGTFKLTGKALNTIGGSLTLGTAALGVATKVDAVADKLTLGTAGANDLLGGSSLTVNELAVVGILNVGSNVANSTGNLSVTKLGVGGTIFADPAWTSTGAHATSYASQVAIQEFTVAGVLASNLGAGQASQIVIGTADTNWVKAKLDTYNSEFNTSIWGAGVGQVSAVLGITGRTVAVALGSIVVDGSLIAPPVFVAGDAVFATNSLLIVDATIPNINKTSGGLLYALNAPGTITVGEGVPGVSSSAKLMVANGKVGQTYNVAQGATALTIGATGWRNANLLTDHRLLTATLDTVTVANSALVTIGQRSATSVMPKLTAQMGGLLDRMVLQGMTDSDSPNMGERFANRVINRLEGTQAAATVEGAAQTATVGAVQGATLSAQRAGVGAIAARTSFANPIGDVKGASLNLRADGEVTQSGVSGGSLSGGGLKNGLGLWIMPLWQNDNVFGMKAEGFKTGYNSSLGGIAIGADYTVESAYRFGLALNLGGGFAQSSGDFNKTDNSFNFWGISAYGGWTQNNFGLTADVGYSSTFNKVSQSTPAVLQMGNLKSDVHSHAWTVGLRAEYKWETGALDITPHVGARFTGLTTRGYDVKSGGGTVFRVNDEYQSIWTFPVGVTFSKDIVSDSGWTFRPMIDLGIIPAAGDVDARSRVRIPGVATTAEMKTQVVDHWTFDGTAGFEVKNQNVSLGLNYNLQASEHRTGHGLFATFRYEF